MSFEEDFLESLQIQQKINRDFLEYLQIQQKINRDFDERLKLLQEIVIALNKLVGVLE